ncbi:uncharacterized protein L203_103495 [Cryptococcus depauperatus CBS 7841]|uniref:Uncharacterized protein n=1 Tax=Cryptococcus depauperatus CBS 7841 TaxID=1295531 RepID=A0A1E3II79_9TREE|nr:hypothetical protein L203_02909 [Cryptococcus depauperatus CBS 7841]
MSASSQMTLISQSSRSNQPPPLQRRASAHNHSHHHGHVSKRRASQHSHGHARRSSEGETGRRALAAGLAMHALDHSGRKKKHPQERLAAHGSRSDTNLPRLSRTNSQISNHSRNSDTSTFDRRPSVKSRRSAEKARILDEHGQEINEDQGEWESGEEHHKNGSDKVEQAQSSVSSTTMRRIASDTSADTHSKSSKPIMGDALARGNLMENQGGGERRPALTQRTTGFAGTVQPPDPQVAAEIPVEHPIIQNPIRRVASSKSLVGPISAMPLIENTLDVGLHVEPLNNVKTKGIEQRDLAQALPSTSSSRISVVTDTKFSESPSYPFPKMPSPDNTRDYPNSTEETRARKHSASTQTGQQSRQASFKAAVPSLRHRPSNSSLRSVQSLRAPPHPLNSPNTCRRSGVIDSPSRDGKRERVTSMHQPPIPQPQISYEVAQGQGWGQILEEDAFRKSISNESNTGPSVVGTMRSRDLRRSSEASTRSIRSIFGNTISSLPPASPQPSKRLTAFEAATAAAKRPTTNNPALYHHSLGHPSGSAESCFLISRFLPPKKISRPKWEINIHDQDRIENGNVGLTNGDYRSAHESLVSTLRDLVAGPDAQKRNMSRYPVYGIIPSSLTLSSVAAAASGIAGSSHTQNGGEAPRHLGGLGNLIARDGFKSEAAKGVQKGLTPFEQSVQRVVAQRPGRMSL